VRTDNGNPDQVCHVKDIFICKKGKDQQKNHEEAEPDFHEKRLEDGLILLVCIFEVAAPHAFKAPSLKNRRFQFRVNIRADNLI
jgi:hypothetical protein